MRLHAVFCIALAGLAVPSYAQQHTEVQPSQQAQYPVDLTSGEGAASVAERTGALHIRVGARADGTCWAASGSRRVSAERAGVFGNAHRAAYSVTARPGVPKQCLDTVLASLRGAGVSRIL